MLPYEFYPVLPDRLLITSDATLLYILVYSALRLQFTHNYSYFIN
jgi:hypothetical protein